MVTLKFQVQDPNGYFIPSIRPNNFVVYENGIRQTLDHVEIEHAPATVAQLLEYGGRTPGLGRLVGPEITRAGREFIDVLTNQDEVGVWKYGDKVEKLTNFSPKQDAFDALLSIPEAPPLSETNLYDAVCYMVPQMERVQGRKAILLISSGVDTFSKATNEDAVAAAGHSGAPIYVISMIPTIRDFVDVETGNQVFAHFDWSQPQKVLQAIAEASGGRVYSPESSLNLSAIYDDLIENLKIRYVIRYRSSNNTEINAPRTLRVDLVDPETGAPLKIVDSKGRMVRAKLEVEDSYIPSKASAQ
jgi:VWFA-related protein